jgi:hypothetical protein
MFLLLACDSLYRLPLEVALGRDMLPIQSDELCESAQSERESAP